jgi:hypothetical protein
MTRFIGQITVLIGACDTTAAEKRLRKLAQQLEDGEADILFADHNGDLQDAAAVEAECAESLAQGPNSLRPFDGYEIHGVCEYNKDTDPYCGQVPDSEAEFWSLYGHIPGQGLECIGDFKTREFAEEVYARITGRRLTITADITRIPAVRRND